MKVLDMGIDERDYLYLLLNILKDMEKKGYNFDQEVIMRIFLILLTILWGLLWLLGTELKDNKRD